MKIKWNLTKVKVKFKNGLQSKILLHGTKY